jgi:hypothetical protein
MEFKPVLQRHDKAVIIGGGESLHGFDFGLLDGFDGAIIAVNYSALHLPRTDYFVTSDNSAHTILDHPKCRKAYRFACVDDDGFHEDDSDTNNPKPRPKRNTHYLHRISCKAMAEEKNEIAKGNSFRAAVNLAYHFEVKKLVLLGLDLCGRMHWYDMDDAWCSLPEFEYNAKVEKITAMIASCKPQLDDRGVTVLNGSQRSHVKAFTRVAPEDAIQWIIKEK